MVMLCCVLSKQAQGSSCWQWQHQQRKTQHLTIVFSMYDCYYYPYHPTIMCSMKELQR